MQTSLTACELYFDGFQICSRDIQVQPTSFSQENNQNFACTATDIGDYTDTHHWQSVFGPGRIHTMLRQVDMDCNNANIDLVGSTGRHVSCSNPPLSPWSVLMAVPSYFWANDTNTSLPSANNNVSSVASASLLAGETGRSVKRAKLGDLPNDPTHVIESQNNNNNLILNSSSLSLVLLGSSRFEEVENVDTRINNGFCAMNVGNSEGCQHGSYLSGVGNEINPIHDMCLQSYLKLPFPLNTHLCLLPAVLCLWNQHTGKFVSTTMMQLQVIFNNWRVSATNVDQWMQDPLHHNVGASVMSAPLNLTSSSATVSSGYIPSILLERSKSAAMALTDILVPVDKRHHSGTSSRMRSKKTSSSSSTTVATSTTASSGVKRRGKRTTIPGSSALPSTSSARRSRANKTKKNQDFDGDEYEYSDDHGSIVDDTSSMDEVSPSVDTTKNMRMGVSSMTAAASSIGRRSQQQNCGKCSTTSLSSTSSSYQAKQKSGKSSHNSSARSRQQSTSTAAAAGGRRSTSKTTASSGNHERLGSSTYLESTDDDADFDMSGSDARGRNTEDDDVESSLLLTDDSDGGLGTGSGVATPRSDHRVDDTDDDDNNDIPYAMRNDDDEGEEDDDGVSLASYHVNRICDDGDDDGECLMYGDDNELDNDMDDDLFDDENDDDGDNSMIDAVDDDL